MPRGKLNEVYVQRIAVEWLENYYRDKLNPLAIVAGLEARTRKSDSLKDGRADGLIAAQLHNGLIYTISIEAKSSRTWKALKVQRLYEKMLAYSIGFSLLMIFVIRILGVIGSQTVFLHLILLFVSLTVVGFSFINFSPLKFRYWETEVAKQAQRYPANEKWIALSTDVYNKLRTANQAAHFEKICVKRGIGLIRISSSTKCFIVIHPKPIVTPKGLDSYLACYLREQIIRDQISLVLQQPKKSTEPILLDKPEGKSAELFTVELEDVVEIDNEQEVPL